MKRAVIPALVLLLSAYCLTANAFIIDIGFDTLTIRMPDRLTLNPRILESDGVTDYPDPDALTYQWSRISGPNSGLIRTPDQYFTMVDSLTTGIYKFALSASLGNLIAADTVQVTVLDSIPLKLLGPVAGEKIELGSKYTLKWQVYPDRTPMRIDLSADGGTSFPRELIIVQSQVRDSFVWVVPDTLEPGDNYVIKLRWYHNHEHLTYSPAFSLVPKREKEEKKGLCGTGLGLAFLPPVGFKLVSLRRRKRRKAN